MSRRAGPACLLLLLACASGATDSSGSNPPAHVLVGADVSALERIEQAGGVFKHGDTPGDALAILRQAGAGLFRLRIFVQPDGSEVQVNDLAYTLRMASRVKATGAQLLLDLHYSDTWADPGHQATPAGWDTVSIDTLERQVEDYTASVMTALRDQGTLPRIVQVGNEIDGGMLWPLGRVGGAYDTPVQWGRLARLLKAGIRGVKSVVTPADSVRIMLHFSGGGSTAGTAWFMDHLRAERVDFDILGLSYYPWWHGTLAQLKANLNTVASGYSIPVMVVETQYPWRVGGWENGITHPDAMHWPVTSAGQAAFLDDVLKTVATVQGGRGLGVVWWYPESIAVNNLFVYGGGSLALFGPGGDALPAVGILSVWGDPQ